MDASSIHRNESSSSRKMRYSQSLSSMIMPAETTNNTFSNGQHHSSPTVAAFSSSRPSSVSEFNPSPSAAASSTSYTHTRKSPSKRRKRSWWGRMKYKLEHNLLLLGKKRPVTSAFVCLTFFWMVCTCLALIHVHFSSDKRSAVSSDASSRLPFPGSVRNAAPFLRAGGAQKPIPLPLPKEKVSVVLTNFNRPKLIRDSSMMRTLLSHPSIDEVLLLHANSHTAFEFVHPKVVNIDAIEQNEEMGLSLKYYYCQFTKNKWVLHLDDDIEFTTDALNELFIEFGRNQRRLVGRYGRNFSKKNGGYDPKDAHKSAEVILSKMMVMERDTCSAFFEYAYLLWNDVILHETEGPLWNGDDIFMSLIANHVYGSTDSSVGNRPKPYNNYAMDWLDVWQAEEDTEIAPEERYDITDGFDGLGWWEWRWWQNFLSRNRQYLYRGRLWEIAKERLDDLDQDQQP